MTLNEKDNPSPHWLRESGVRGHVLDHLAYFIIYLIGSFGPLRVKHSHGYEDTDIEASVSEVWKVECACLVSCLGSSQGEDGKQERCLTFPLTLILVSGDLCDVRQSYFHVGMCVTQEWAMISLQQFLQTIYAANAAASNCFYSHNNLKAKQWHVFRLYEHFLEELIKIYQNVTVVPILCFGLNDYAHWVNVFAWPFLHQLSVVVNGVWSFVYMCVHRWARRCL